MKKSNRIYIFKTSRIVFSKWDENDMKLAILLWGDARVTKYICATGMFTQDAIADRLKNEIDFDKRYKVQYWPIFDLETEDFIGCCGLHPHGKNEYELGFHLRPEYWGKGYAGEAANAVIDYAFNTLSAGSIFAGHNPNNVASKKRLLSLGFQYIDDEYYQPTGLYHPSYRMER